MTESLANIWLKAERSVGVSAQNRFPSGIVGLTVSSRSSEEAMNLARYLASVVARAHGRQMKPNQRRAWCSVLAKNHKASLETPSWLWASVVELLGLHEAAYLDHCRRFALSEAA